MAADGASHNVAGGKTGPSTGPPPTLGHELKEALLGNADADATGQSSSGWDGSDKDTGKKVKMEKELEKDAQFYIKEFEDGEAEAEYEPLVSRLKALRFLAVEYVIKDPATTYIQPLDSATHITISSISIFFPAHAAPTGCAVYTVGTSATAFLDINGRIDVKKEISKAKERMKKAGETVEKQMKIMGAGDWEEKVSEAVKETEREKLKAAERMKLE